MLFIVFKNVFKTEVEYETEKKISYAPTIPIIVGREKFAARAFCPLRYQVSAGAREACQP